MKKSRILLVTDVLSFGGLETHLEELINNLPPDREFILCCRKNEYFKDENIKIYNGLVSGLSNDHKSILSDVTLLTKLIEKYKIDIVHSHAFLNLIPSVLAANNTKIPHVLTIHGPAGILPSYGPLGNLFFYSFVIKKLNAICVSKELIDLTNKHLQIPLERLALLNNPIKKEENAPYTSFKWKAAAFISRLDDFKVKGLINFLRTNKESLSFYISKLYIVGDGPAKTTLEGFSKEWNDDKIEMRFLGYIPQPAHLFPYVDFILGMGRVALEGISHNKPVLLVGYDGFKGLVGAENFQNLLYANFSGRNMKNILLHKGNSIEPCPLEYLDDLFSESSIKKYCDILDALNFTNNPELDGLHNFLVEFEGEKFNSENLEALIKMSNAGFYKEFDFVTTQTEIAKRNIEIDYLHFYIGKCNAMIADLSKAKR